MPLGCRPDLMLELHIVNPCFRNNCLESFLSHQLSRLGQRKWILTDSEWYYINVDFNYRLLKIETVIMFIKLYITFSHKSYLTILFLFSYFHNLIACVISILQTDARIYLHSDEYECYALRHRSIKRVVWVKMKLSSLLVILFSVSVPGGTVFIIVCNM